MKHFAFIWSFWAGAVAALPVAAAPKPISQPQSKPKLQPTLAPLPIAPVVGELLQAEPAHPQIHGPSQVGVSPGHEFIFRIPATGREPLSYAVTGLPATLKQSGPVIRGIVAKAGTYLVQLKVSGPGGTATRRLSIVCGPNKLALLPPLGWNSWNVFGEDVTAAKVAQQADLMIKIGLASRGWSYVVVDDSWQARRGADGSIRPRPGFLSKRFPDLPALAEFLHERGLKLGLMTSPNKLTPLGHAGSAEHEDADAKQFAAWGVDYLKCDWSAENEGVPDAPQEPAPSSAITPPAVPLSPEEERAQNEAKRAAAKEARAAEARRRAEEMRASYARMHAALDKSGRDILLGAVTYGFGGPDFEWVKEVGVQSWTNRPALADNWDAIRRNGDALNDFASFARPGLWTDPGPLMLGRFIPKNPRFSKLSLDEQQTQMTLWALAPAPLMLSCNLSQLDPNNLYPVTTALLSNSEVLAINQDPLQEAARKIELPTRPGERRDIFDVWMRPLLDGTLAVALCNWRPRAEPASLLWSDLGLSGPQKVRDVWLRRDLGTLKEGFSVPLIPGHGAILLRVGTPR